MTLESLRAYVSQGSGYVESDGSDYCCGDVSGTGLICTLYRPEAKRCLILGNRLQIVPSVTCIHQLTGPELPSDTPIQEIATPAEVGLTDTKEGANCRRCDWSLTEGAQSICRLLSGIMVSVGQTLGVTDVGKFNIQPGACCDYWCRAGVEEKIDW